MLALLALLLLAGCGAGDDGARPGPRSLLLEVTAPRAGASVTGSAVRVRGRVTPGATVTVDGVPARATDGRFALRIDADPGENRVTIEARKDGYEPASRAIAFSAVRAEPSATRRSTALRLFLARTFGGALEDRGTLEEDPSAPWFPSVDLARTVVRRDGSVSVATTLEPGAAARRQARLICAAARGFASPRHAGRVEVLAGDRSRLARC